jgi:hypothetical protein
MPSSFFWSRAMADSLAGEIFIIWAEHFPNLLLVIFQKIGFSEAHDPPPFHNTDYVYLYNNTIWKKIK